MRFRGIDVTFHLKYCTLNPSSLKVATVKSHDITEYTTTQVRAKWLENAVMFEREVAVYFEIMPALRRLSGSIKVPRAFYGDAEKGVLIMEDLKRQGFSIQDKRDGQSDD